MVIYTFCITCCSCKFSKKKWDIEVDFSKAYDEAKYFKDNKDSWICSGKHCLFLRKKGPKI